MFLSSIGSVNTLTAEDIADSVFCRTTDKPEFIANNKLTLNANIELPQFVGEDIAPWHKDINAQLLEIKSKWTEDFVEELKFHNFKDFEKYTCELEIKSEVLLNTPRIFSCIIRIFAYQHSANGCQRHVEAKNFLCENGRAKLLKLEDVARKEKIEKILSLAVRKIANDNKIKTLNNAYTESDFIADAKEQDSITNEVQFAMTSNSIVIIFPAYTIAAGAEGVLSCELKYKDIENLLVEEIIRQAKY